AGSHGYNGGHGSAPPPTTPNANAFAAANNTAATNKTHPNGSWAWSHGYNGGHGNSSGSHAHWNSNNMRDHNVSHWSANDRATWQHGRWQHGRHHGRNGWWWYSGGAWFFYDQPVYPYPTYASTTYYDDDYYDDGDGYGDYNTDPDYGAEPGDGGYYWYYCNNPAGYYPYVKSCRGPWRAVTPTPDAQQGGYDQAGPDDDDQGPPPGYDDRGPAPRDQFNGPDDDRGPPPGYSDNDRGPPPGYDNGPDDEDDDSPQR
ncbi:MAG: hypothetical protein ACTHPD_09535, partial [Rhizomicrobium sp.]